MRRVRARRCGDLEFRQPSCHPDATLSAAKGAEDLLLLAAVIGMTPTVLNANGANQKKFDESLLVRRRMKSQRARTNIFFGTAAQDAMRNVPGVRSKEEKFCSSSVSSGPRRYYHFIGRIGP